MNKTRRAGRKPTINSVTVAKWRRGKGASIAETAEHFGISARSVAKACADEAEARADWKREQQDREVIEMDYAERMLEVNWGQLNEAVARADRAREKGVWDEDAFYDVLDAAHRLIPADHRDRRWR